MMFDAPPTPDEEVKELPRARTLGLVILVGYIAFVLAYLLLWETHPSWQLILNRISWSSSDFIGLAATGLALYSYNLFQKYSRNKDIIYLQQFALQLKKAGIEPSDISPICAMVKSLSSEVGNDPDFQVRLMKAADRVTKEKLGRLKRLSEDELFELLRSSGGKLV
jgi:hypothetical protein